MQSQRLSFISPRFVFCSPWVTSRIFYTGISFGMPNWLRVLWAFAVLSSGLGSFTLHLI